MHSPPEELKGAQDNPFAQSFGRAIPHPSYPAAVPESSTSPVAAGTLLSSTSQEFRIANDEERITPPISDHVAAEPPNDSPPLVCELPPINTSGSRDRMPASAHASAVVAAPSSGSTAEQPAAGRLTRAERLALARAKNKEKDPSDLLPRVSTPEDDHIPAEAYEAAGAAVNGSEALIPLAARISSSSKLPTCSECNFTPRGSEPNSSDDEGDFFNANDLIAASTRRSIPPPLELPGHDRAMSDYGKSPSVEKSIILIKKERAEWQAMLREVLTTNEIRSERRRLSFPNQGANTFLSEDAQTPTTTSDSIWVELRAKLNGRTKVEESRRLEAARRSGEVDELIAEVANFKIKPRSEAGTPLEQVKSILRRFDMLEAMYPSSRSFFADRPEAGSEQVQKVLEVLNTWLGMTSSIDRQIRVFRGWTGSENLDISRKEGAWSAATGSMEPSRNPSFLERVLRETGIQGCFERRLLSDLNVLLDKARHSLNENFYSFSRLGLPPYTEPLRRLARLPGRLMELFLKVRLEYADKLEKDTSLFYVDQFLDDFKTNLSLATAIKARYQVLAQPIERTCSPNCGLPDGAFSSKNPSTDHLGLFDDGVQRDSRTPAPAVDAELGPNISDGDEEVDASSKCAPNAPIFNICKSRLAESRIEAEATLDSFQSNESLYRIPARCGPSQFPVSVPTLGSRYDAILLNALRFYFRLLDLKLDSVARAGSFFREAEILENEYQFLSQTASLIRGGDVEASINMR
jgi:hypothetical protein